MAAEIWLTEKYYEEFHRRLGHLFTEDEALDVYKGTQELMNKWPNWHNNPPPEVGQKKRLFYVKYDWPNCRLRICFGAETVGGTSRLLILTCRTKQELSKGTADGTANWYDHMATQGERIWDQYRRGTQVCWKIY